MARKPALSIDSLEELGTEKLAKLILDEAERSASFRKLVAAALARAKGPEAVAKLIDRRIGALEKARLHRVGQGESLPRRSEGDRRHHGRRTGQSFPAMAIERLLRFVATHESVFERVDDFSGGIQEVYYDAIAAIGDLAAKLKADEADLLPESIMASLGESTHGYLVDVAKAVTGRLSEMTLSRWDGMLAAPQRKQTDGDGKKDRYHSTNVSQLRNVRQAIANARGDLDGDRARGTEASQFPGHHRDCRAPARGGQATRSARLGAQGEPLSAEIYKPGGYCRRGFATRRAITAAVESRSKDPRNTWRKASGSESPMGSVEGTLNAGMLRDYIDALPDFDEFEGLDRAFAHALGSKRLYLALEFFLEWPRLDLAAKIVVDNHLKWAVQLYHILLPPAEALTHDHPVAATILYRALLDDILTRARSKAYPHAARYLKKLDELAVQSDDGSLQSTGIDAHPTYRSALRKSHSRKAGFWALAPQER